MKDTGINRNGRMYWHLLMLLLLLAWTAAAAPATVALVPGEGPRAPGPGALAQVEAALSQSPELALVERAEIQRVLNEQKLTVGTLLQSGQAVKLGQLVAAQLLVFVEKIPGGEPAAWRVQVIETRTGLSLGGLIGTERSLAANPAPIVAALSTAVAKIQGAPERRHYLGILGVRSEELNRSLDGLAESFAMFLTSDLAESPEVVVLERERLEHLRAEEALTGIDLLLKTSATLIEGGVKYGESKSELKFTFSLRSPGSQAGTVVRVVVPADNPAKARRLLTEAILAQCKLVRPDKPALEARNEAAAFAERAGLLDLTRETEAAVRAAEAAATLNPTLEYRRNAAGAWHALAFEHFLKGSGWDSNPVPTEWEQLRMFRTALRFWDLQLQLFQEQAAKGKADKTTPLPSLPSRAMMPLRATLQHTNAELLALRQELQGACRSFYNGLRACYAQRWEQPSNGWEDDPQWQWSRLADDSIGWLADWTDDVREWAQMTRETAEHVDAPPGKVAAHHAGNGREPFFNQVFFYYRLADEPPFSRFQSPAESRLVLDCYDALASNTNAALRLSALVAKFRFIQRREHRRDLQTANAALQVFLHDLPVSHPLRQCRNDATFPHDVMAMVFEGLQGPEERQPFARAILDSLLATGDAARLELWWPRILEPFLTSLVAGGKKEEALALLGRMLRLLEVGQRKSGLLRPLQQWQARLQGVARPPLADRTLQAEPLSLNSFPTNLGRVVLSQRLPDRLVLVWEDRPLLLASRKVRVRVTTTPLEGGGYKELGLVDFPSPVPQQYCFLEHVHWLCAEPEATYVGTVGGLGVFAASGTRLLTESNGLPVNDVVCAARFGARVYLGVGASAPLHLRQAAADFVEFDPATARFKVLASGRSLEKQSALDGLRGTLTGMLADTNHQCLWFSVASPARSGEQNGLWKFVPATGQFQQVLRERYSLDRLAWTGRKLVGVEVSDYMNWTGLFAYDPDTLEASTLVRTKGFGWPLPRASLFGNVRTPLWPCVWNAAGLLVGGDASGQVFWLPDATAEPALVVKPGGDALQGVCSLHQVGDQVLAITGAGDLWKIRLPNGTNR